MMTEPHFILVLSPPLADEEIRLKAHISLTDGGVRFEAYVFDPCGVHLLFQF